MWRELYRSLVYGRLEGQLLVGLVRLELASSPVEPARPDGLSHTIPRTGVPKVFHSILANRQVWILVCDCMCMYTMVYIDSKFGCK